MSTDVGTGDSELPYLIVEPADVSTEVVLVVSPPPPAVPYPIVAVAGPLEDVGPGSPDQKQKWTAAVSVVYDQPGLWVLQWQVTGTGQGTEQLEVFVTASPVAGGPAWWPGRSRVANYVPHRTLVRNTSTVKRSQDVYAFTFDSTTTPTGVMVDRLIADGADWVSMLVNPMNVRSEKVAALCAALWAAIAVERAWPNDDKSLQRANDMEKRLSAMVDGLVEANDDANDDDAGDGADYGIEIVPMYPGYCAPSSSGTQIAALLARIAALEAAAAPVSAFSYSAGAPQLVVVDDTAPGVSYSAGVVTVDDSTAVGVTYGSNTLTVTTA